MSFLKAQTFRSDPYLAAVRALPCVACWREGRTQAAHRNQGKGAGLKTHDCWTAALCVECHGEIDQGSGCRESSGASAWTTTSF